MKAKNTKSLEQQLKQLDIEKYLNMTQNHNNHNNHNNNHNNHIQEQQLHDDNHSSHQSLHSSLKTTIIHNNIPTHSTSQSSNSSGSGSSETDEMAPLRDRDNTLITRHNLNLPNTRSNAVSTSSMQVSRATSIIEDSYRDGMYSIPCKD